MPCLKSVYFSVAFTLALREVWGHGMMLDPPNRSSLWRFNDSFPINYDDNENFCGGFGVQWGANGGKCGVCGDNYADPVPRANENTGKYGLGHVVAEYKSGSVIDVLCLLTANHRGWFNYSLCDLKDPSQPESEECFRPLLLEDGSKDYPIKTGVTWVLNRVALPKGFKCEHCVLRWNYKAGNNWGICEDGSGGMGCGPQEHFRSCADIRIV